MTDTTFLQNLANAGFSENTDWGNQVQAACQGQIAAVNAAKQELSNAVADMEGQLADLKNLEQITDPAQKAAMIEGLLKNYKGIGIGANLGGLHFEVSAYNSNGPANGGYEPGTINFVYAKGDAILGGDSIDSIYAYLFGCKGTGSNGTTMSTEQAAAAFDAIVSSLKPLITNELNKLKSDTVEDYWKLTTTIPNYTPTTPLDFAAGRPGQNPLTSYMTNQAISNSAQLDAEEAAAAQHGSATGEANTASNQSGAGSNGISNNSNPNTNTALRNGVVQDNLFQDASLLNTSALIQPTQNKTATITANVSTMIQRQYASAMNTVNQITTQFTGTKGNIDYSGLASYMKANPSVVSSINRGVLTQFSSKGSVDLNGLGSLLQSNPVITLALVSSENTNRMAQFILNTLVKNSVISADTLNTISQYVINAK